MKPLERKAMLVARGVEMQHVARDAGVSKARVSEVVYGRFIFDTPRVRKVKALIAERCGVPVAELWPDDESLATLAAPAAGAA